MSSTDEGRTVVSEADAGALRMYPIAYHTPIAHAQRHNGWRARHLLQLSVARSRAEEEVIKELRINTYPRSMTGLKNVWEKDSQICKPKVH